jgi:hypothetical protein
VTLGLVMLPGVSVRIHMYLIIMIIMYKGLVMLARIHTHTYTHTHTDGLIMWSLCFCRACLRAHICLSVYLYLYIHVIYLSRAGEWDTNNRVLVENDIARFPSRRTSLCRRCLRIAICRRGVR